MTIEKIGHKLLNFASNIADNTIEQAKETAAMPFVHPHVALMPDAHLGKGSAVGTVIPTLDAVIPAAVGVDIGCGMIAARTVYTATDIAGRDLAALRESLESAIPLSPGNYNKNLARFTFTEARIEALQNLPALRITRCGQQDRAEATSRSPSSCASGGGSIYRTLTSRTYRREHRSSPHICGS